jgi:hypothetical protein
LTEPYLPSTIVLGEALNLCLCLVTLGKGKQIVKPAHHKAGFLFFRAGLEVLVMRKKMILSFLAGVLITIIATTATLLFVSSAKAEENTSRDTTIVSVDEISMNELTTALQKVRTEIQDPDILTYYDTLIAGYDLENITDIEGAGLPDMKKIYNTASTLPFQEVGKQINDPEIKAFYDRFLKQSGLSD